MNNFDKEEFDPSKMPPIHHYEVLGGVGGLRSMPPKTNVFMFDWLRKRYLSLLEGPKWDMIFSSLTTQRVMLQTYLETEE